MFVCKIFIENLFVGRNNRCGWIDDLELSVSTIMVIPWVVVYMQQYDSE